jgi:hypothetical protein
VDEFVPIPLTAGIVVVLLVHFEEVFLVVLTLE